MTEMQGYIHESGEIRQKKLFVQSYGALISNSEVSVLFGMYLGVATVLDWGKVYC